ncbi:MAG TPA: PASTA domain-containing protein [Baekduia sp.]|nr:PASTA domain-containing protein [Baekduia sp.]
MTLKVATRRLTRAGCKLGRVSRRASSSRYAGKVVRSSPKAGTELAGGAKVDVVLGRRARRA